MIKTLVATAKTQGARDNDYNWSVEDELVWFPPTCDSSARNGPDDRCGCGRGFGGLSSHKATTTAIVTIIEGMSKEEYVEAFASSLDAQGYGAEIAPELAGAMLDMVAAVAPGTVYERRLDQLHPRTRGA